MFFRHYKEYFQMIVLCLLIDFKYCTANVFTVRRNAICNIIRRINAMFDCFPCNHFPFGIDMIVSLPKLNHCSVFERPLIVKNKLFSVIFRKRY